MLVFVSLGLGSLPVSSDAPLLPEGTDVIQAYCPQQCALIHIEKVFDENVFTLRGSIAHERVDKPIDTVEDDVTVERALPI